MKNLCLVLSFIWGVNFASLADSPLTSTVFYKAYLNVSEVKLASESEVLTVELMDFLSNNTNQAVHKLAVVNALGWGDTVKTTTYETYLFSKYPELNESVFTDLRAYEDSIVETPSMKLLSSDELMVWSSLQINGDYFAPIKGANAAIIITRNHREVSSQAHVLPLALILCQIHMDSRDTWCNVYKSFIDNMFNYEYSDNLFSEEALNNMLDYISLYKDSCDD